MEFSEEFTGLSDEQVIQNRLKYGNNILTPPPKDPIWKLYIEKFKDPLIRILIIAAFLSFIISIFEKDFYETFGILLAIFLATAVGFWFEYDARRKFDILNLVNDEIPCKVIRNGNVTEVPRKDLVVGDLIILTTGEEVPADAILLESVSLRIDESSLTGEPVTYKTAHPEMLTLETTYPPNEILRGTIIVDGHCKAKIIRVGDQTEYGKVAREATRFTDQDIPLNAQLERLAKLIGVGGFAFATLTFGILFIKGLINGHYSAIQWGSSLITMVSIGIMISKVWAPFIQDAFGLFKRHSKTIHWIISHTWGHLILAGLVFFILFMLIGYLAGIHPFDLNNWISRVEAEMILHDFMVAVTIIVVAVPEGLPMSVTLSLALNMRRMLKHNSLVRKMHAVESMGAVNVICTDKTGTLTQNQMQVSEFFTPAFNHPSFFSLISVGIALNSTAHLDMSNPDDPKPLGNPTESALLLWLLHQETNYEDLRNRYKIIDQLVFSTDRKYMATLVEDKITQRKILHIKGAPEILLKMCSQIFTSQGITDIVPEQITLEDKLKDYQRKAMRILGFAFAEVSSEVKPFKDGKINTHHIKPIFLGVCAIHDPLRPDAAKAVKTCMDAGIEVKLITGDNRGTAQEIGRQIGLLSLRNEEELIAGEDFERLNEDEAHKQAMHIKVMYRARPIHKQRLVQLLQKHNKIVAVTGDGTNDAAALNQAHVGLSMGSGTAVAREASDITIIDDSFQSIVNAIMWGRSLYRNIQRFIIFQLTINVAALLLVFAGSLAGHQVPLNIIQMLWINLIMDTFAAAALSTLPPHSSVMMEKPRRNQDFIINPEMRNWIQALGFLFFSISLGLFLYFDFRSEGINAKELTLVFTTFVMLQFWNLFNVKTFGTNQSAFSGLSRQTGFLVVLSIILIGQILIVEFGGEMFKTKPLSLIEWITTILLTSIILWVGEGLRYIKRTSSSTSFNG
ncbi:MAG: cation-translocating P-type ATPase [Bacteroidales bacterium]|jgi:Ca2+-transporting ATPase|nr:cation-translocating P-type ATPase [Bacteroidales bacterium]